MNKFTNIFLGSVTSYLLTATSYSAVAISIQQVGDDVVIKSDGGTLDTTGLTMSTQAGDSFDFPEHIVFGAGNSIGTDGPVTEATTSFTSGSATITTSQSANWTWDNDFNGTHNCFFVNTRTGSVTRSGSGQLRVNFISNIVTLGATGLVGVNTLDSFEFIGSNRELFNLDTPSGLTANSSFTTSWSQDGIFIDSVTVQVLPSVVAVPEPSSTALVGIGALGLLMRRCK